MPLRNPEPAGSRRGKEQTFKDPVQPVSVRELLTSVSVEAAVRILKTGVTGQVKAG